MIYLQRAFVSCLLLLLFLHSLSADTAVFPATLADAEGVSLDQDGFEIPLGPWPNDVSKSHAIYDSEGFRASGPIRINKFHLRPDRDSIDGSTIGYDNLKLVFAVTPKAPSELSGMFADNLETVIVDPVTVYDDVWESKVSSPKLSNGTRPFDFEIPLTSPFEFNPGDGNLLVEWVFGRPTNPETRFDVDLQWGLHPDQATSFATGVDPIGGGGVGGFGVVTQFEFETVPEPSFGLSTALFALTLASRFRRRR